MNANRFILHVVLVVCFICIAASILISRVQLRKALETPTLTNAIIRQPSDYKTNISITDQRDRLVAELGFRRGMLAGMKFQDAISAKAFSNEAHANWFANVCVTSWVSKAEWKSTEKLKP